MSSCTSLYSDFLTEMNSQKDFLATVLMLALMFIGIIYILYRMNTSNRKLLLMFQDYMRNLIISILMLLFSPALLSLICFSFAFISPLPTSGGNDFTALIQFGDQQMYRLQNYAASLIKEYRRRAIEEFGPASIQYTSFSSIGQGSVYLPTKAMPKAVLFLERSNDAIGAMNGVLVSLAIQRFILNLLVSTNLFYILLILSLAIRIAPALREAGDFMYAFTIAIFIVLPMLYTLFTYPLLMENYESIFCTDMSNILPSGFSYYFLTPLDCYSLSFLNVFTVYAVFMPNLIYGLTFSFASSFKKIFDIFNIGG